MMENNRKLIWLWWSHWWAQPQVTQTERSRWPRFNEVQDRAWLAGPILVHQASQISDTASQVWVIKLYEMSHLGKLLTAALIQVRNELCSGGIDLVDEALRS